MSWYRTGTVAVTNGSKNVTGVGTLFSTAVSPGDAFALVDANGNPTGAWYEVESVTNNTTLVLKQSYAGSTGSNKQYCVFNLVGNMTTPSFAQRLAQFFDSFQSLIDKPTTTPVANSIPVSDSGGKIASGWLPDATTTTKGAVELATTAEAQAGTDATRAVTPATSGSRTTFAVTSTDDATSVTSAPLKSAGGLAVAKDAWVGGDTRLTVGGVHGNAIFAKVFSSPGDAGTYKIKIASQVIAGALDISVIGTYATTDREGYASYKALFNRETDSITIIPVQEPKNTGGSFTTGYSFNVTKPDTDTLEIAITKGSGAIYYVGIQGVFARPGYPKTVTTEFIPA